MDDVAGVGFDERVHDLEPDIDGITQRQRSSPDARRQHLALDVLHDEEVGALVLADVVDGGDVRRAQRRRGARLGQKSRAALLVVLRLGRQELERHLTTEPGVFGEVDLAHAACPKAVPDPVVLDRAADHPAILTADVGLISGSFSTSADESFGTSAVGSLEPTMLGPWD